MMEAMGQTIRYLRKAMGVTQEKLAQQLCVSYQTVSKWERGATLPDVTMLPALAACFGVSIDELFGYQLQALTDKERLIALLAKNRVLVRHAGDDEQAMEYDIQSEQLTTNALLCRIGEAFADAVRENHLPFDAMVGLAYHGIGIATAAASALYTKYGMTVPFCYDRQKPDSRGRMLCGHTLEDGERVLIVDDLLASGHSLTARVERMREKADVTVSAVMVMVDKRRAEDARLLEEKWGTKVYALLCDQDIRAALENHIVTMDTIR